MKLSTIHVSHSDIDRTLCGREIRPIVGKTLSTITETEYWARRASQHERAPVCRPCCRLAGARTVRIAASNLPRRQPPRTPRRSQWGDDHAHD